MNKSKFLKLRGYTGIYRNISSGKYRVIKRINGKKKEFTLDLLEDAIAWAEHYDGTNEEEVKKYARTSKCAPLNIVWEEMNRTHIKYLARGTRDIWHRRYELVSQLDHLPMDEITPSVISKWVNDNTEFFKSDEYVQNSRGKAKRCNLDNELNLITTIFNWYRQADQFEQESINVQNPVRTKHKKMGFIRPKPVRNMNISVDEVQRFLFHLPQMYQDLAWFQYLTAARIGEAAGAQWPRVDFTNKRMVIQETCAWDMGNKTFIGLNPHPKNKENLGLYILTLK